MIFDSDKIIILDSDKIIMEQKRIEAITAYHALEGYLSALEAGKPVAQEYIDRLNTWYLANIAKALGLI